MNEPQVISIPVSELERLEKILREALYPAVKFQMDQSLMMIDAYDQRGDAICIVAERIKDFTEGRE